jgi:hypothetical protein
LPGCFLIEVSLNPTLKRWTRTSVVSLTVCHCKFTFPWSLTKAENKEEKKRNAVSSPPDAALNSAFLGIVGAEMLDSLSPACAPSSEQVTGVWLRFQLQVFASNCLPPLLFSLCFIP